MKRGSASVKLKEQNWFAKWRVHVGKGLVIHYKCEGCFPQRRGRSKERAYKRKIEKRRGISLEQWVIIHHFLRWRRKLGGEGGCFPQRQRKKKRKSIYTQNWKETRIFPRACVFWFPFSKWFPLAEASNIIWIFHEARHSILQEGSDPMPYSFSHAP